MKIFYVILILYTVAIIWGTIKLENFRYRLFLGYIAGIALGTILLLIVDFDVAIIMGLIALASTAKMMMSPNR